MHNENELNHLNMIIRLFFITQQQQQQNNRQHQYSSSMENMLFFLGKRSNGNETEWSMI